MSVNNWVLILISDRVGSFPAVIGGYEDRALAEKAGDLATAYSAEPFAPSPAYTRYTVIPGAACSEPLGATHSTSWREWENDGVKVGHKVQRFPEGI